MQTYKFPAPLNNFNSKMQLLHSQESASEPGDFSQKPLERQTPITSSVDDDFQDVDDLALDVSGNIVEFPALENAQRDSESVESLYLYKNVYSLIPKSLGGGRLRTLKFFGNEVNLFAPEFGDLASLECLQVKVSLPGTGGLPFYGLKELELSKVPPRASDFPVSTQIASLKRMTKLSIWHFSIRYLLPEIGGLKNMEYLDLSFNKLKTLPSEISCLNGLISSKVANNKLVELPSAMTSLSRLENLDLSNNSLTSVGSLELGSMQRLQLLNLQYNKLLSICPIPP